ASFTAYMDGINKGKYTQTYNKDLVKALCVPFAYNLPRFKNLSIEILFDRNETREKTKKNTSLEEN
ncbi:MAG: hypothetical protein J5760_02775, partial [Clostridia bacterium]|nr:hypothetical protein [Clostridia bacterium]